MARQFRDDHLPRYKEMVENYVSHAYRKNVGTSIQENHYHEFIRLTTGRVIHNNPRTRVTTRRSGTQQQVAMAMQGGLNRWCVDYDIQTVLTDVYADFCFAYSPVLTTIEQRSWHDPRSESIPSWPACYRLYPDRFFFDPGADSFESARFSGHTYIRDLSDVMAEAKDNPEIGWNVDVLENAVKASNDDVYRRVGRDNIPERNEVVFHEMWIPEWEIGDPNDGFNGALVTLVEGQGEKWVREPRPFYGPRWGPYTMFGAYPVVNDPYPLSPFVATYEQIMWLNKIVSASNEAIAKYKRLILCSASNPDLIAKLKSNPDSLVVPVQGFQKDQTEQYEVGGITEQHMAQIELAMQRVDRNTGISNIQRGNVEGDATATEVDIASQASDASLAYVKQKFSRATSRMLRTVAWYLYHDDRIEFPLGADPEMLDPMTGMPMVEPWFVGGSFDVDSGATFDDLELEIEPTSMEQTNGPLMRAQTIQKIEIAMQMAEFARMHPEWDSAAMLRNVGQAFNDPGMEKWYNAEMANAMLGMPGLQQAAFPPEQGPQLTKAGDKPKNASLGSMNGAVQRQATQGMPMGMGAGR